MTRRNGTAGDKSDGIKRRACSELSIRSDRYLEARPVLQNDQAPVLFSFEELFGGNGDSI
ncbi:hypothetical protein KIN20_020743 [Parelaphostrongylus tenuis]|uniref:Uncharacterized protein n=1 Tax=Parelaphostrongylus tenuis TaxID=148309 RepID=A0AAD5NA23_PARTN|nr:hypothetical protein KIN20_020743 [Parelaphostrongylus tenuis]